MFSQETTSDQNKKYSISVESKTDIKNLGIITLGRKRCNDTLLIPVYTDENLTEVIDSIKPYNIVRYKRLSELKNKPYWAPKIEDTFVGGEKFKIFHNNRTGWIDDEHLMTFSSMWREHMEHKFIAVDSNYLICIYCSGQFETPLCAAMTIWGKNKNDFWILKHIEKNPIGIGLYSLVAVDSLVRYQNNNLAIQISSKSGDAEDVWGRFAFFIYQNNFLINVYEEKYGYRVDRDYNTLDCKLVLSKTGKPLILKIQKYYKVEGTNFPDDYKVIYTSTDTTIIQLLDNSDNN